MILSIPDYVGEILARLRGAGFLAYPVGGCVRDALLGLEPHDWDVATSALPEQAKAALAGIKTLDTGLKHGTITALSHGNHAEITTLRGDGEYLDGRRPASVTLGAPLERDLARRDFTINAMALGEDGVIDPFGGKRDLNARVIRAVGEPEKRFGEDGLRIMRALRFSAVLGFEIERETARAARQMSAMLGKIARERVRDELMKLLEGVAAVAVLREFTDILCVVLPEIEPAVGFEQNNPHHIYDVWEHTLHATDAAPHDAALRLALLLHDLGKPHCYTEDANGVGHFYGHGQISAEIARRVCAHLRLDSDTARDVCVLVKLHDADFFPSEKSAARWLNRLGERDLRRLLAVKRADNLAQSPQYFSRQCELDEFENAVSRVLEREMCFSLRDLAVKGGDVMALGARGAQIGRVLDELLRLVTDGEAQNEKNALTHKARRILEEEKQS